MKKWLIMLFMIFSLVISGCGGGSNSTPPTSKDSKVLKVADDNVTLNEDSNKTIDVLANDNNADNIVSVTNPSHGVAVIVGDKILYTPNNNYFGADSFEYSASNSDSNEAYLSR